MRLYRTLKGNLIERDGAYFEAPEGDWDALLNHPALLEIAREATSKKAVILDSADVLAPIDKQEVWAAGVTYYRSRDARMEESKDAGGGSFYDRVYVAERPELFFKAAGWRVVAPGGEVRIRRDAKWSVPEPELTLVANASGKLVGVTIGNDMSSRDIEGENPLYLPQAKVYNGSCALGPAVLLLETPLDRSTSVEMAIQRDGKIVFAGRTTLAELKREPEDLLGYLFRELEFPHGVYLMTGTGIVPPDDFTLAVGDRVRIAIQGIGTLENTVG